MYCSKSPLGKSGAAHFNVISSSLRSLQLKLFGFDGAVKKTNKQDNVFKVNTLNKDLQTILQKYYLTRNVNISNACYISHTETRM